MVFALAGDSTITSCIVIPEKRRYACAHTYTYKLGVVGECRQGP
jgi:hypothetical protein